MILLINYYSKSFASHCFCDKNARYHSYTFFFLFLLIKFKFKKKYKYMKIYFLPLFLFSNHLLTSSSLETNGNVSTHMRQFQIFNTPYIDGSWFMAFNATFNNISAISWRPVLLVDKTCHKSLTNFIT